MISYSVVVQWMNGPVKLLEVWFSSDPQIEKNWSEVADRISALSRTWPRRALSLKGKVEVVQVFMTSVISPTT